MNLTNTYAALLLCCLLTVLGANAQVAYENVIEIDGVTMTADSLRAVPAATVLVKGRNRGVESGYNGVFSIVCFKGDTLEFSCLGFRPKQYIVPRDITGQYFSMIQLMVQDTFYLPETIIRPLPSKEKFDYAFLHWPIPDDKYEIARRNTDAFTMRALIYTLPKDGKESQQMQQVQQAHDAMYYGQQKPMSIFSPLAWGEFIEAWKRGDFRRQSSGGE
jgi:hypothetical protein